MRASAKLLVHSLAIGLCWMVTTAHAAPSGSIPGITSLFGYLVQVPSAGANAPGAATTATGWLNQARLAVQKGDRQQAEYCIKKAEQIAAQQGGNDLRLAQSIAQAHRDAESLRSGVQPTRLQRTTTSGSTQLTNTAPKPSSTADAKLRDARQALAAGNVAQASQIVSQAKQSGATIASNGDSTLRLEQLIGQAHQFTGGVSSNNPQYNSAYAAFLLEQADWLARHGDLQTAHRIAGKAKAVPVQYRPTDRTPDHVLAQIAKAQGTTPSRSAIPGATAPTTPANASPKAQAVSLLAQAQLSLDRGDTATAERLTEQARQLNVPENQWASNETRPWEMQLKIRDSSRFGGVAQASYDAPSQTTGAVSRGIYTPANDRSQNVLVDNQQPLGRQISQAAFNPSSQGEKLYQDGLQALNRQDKVAALNLFRQAWQYQDQMTPETRRAVQDKLNSLSPSVAEPLIPGRPSALDEMSQQQMLIRQKVQGDVWRERAVAEKMVEQKNPRGAMTHLMQLRASVESSQLDDAARRQYLTVVDREISELNRFIEQNSVEIEQADINAQRLSDVRNRRQNKVEAEGQIAQLVDTFNKLVDENRLAEAEVVARQAHDLGPDLPVVEVMMWKAKFARRLKEQMAIRDQKEQGFVDTIVSVEASSAPFDDRHPYRIDVDHWADISGRDGLNEETRNPQEIQIKKVIQTTRVNVHYNSMPLADVMDSLSKLAGINILLDPRAMADQAIASETPVQTANLPEPISLESALDIILSEFGLTYEIDNEVVRITTPEMKSKNVFRKAYYVADLVIPIPNFVPNYQMGLPAALANAYRNVGYGSGFAQTGNSTMTTVDDGMGGNQSLFAMAQQGLPNSPLQSGQPGGGMYNGGQGPGGMGGGSQADYDQLIELINTTVAPDSWDEVGGPGSMSPFQSNLSLVISQTQEVHEQIQALLDQLRRLQDLQITIEVRFITLNDDFFERIGVDFNFRVNDNTGLTQAQVQAQDEFNPGITVGLDAVGGITPDLDFSFDQGSFSTTPSFGSPDLNTAANFGFAILSDIEVFMLVQAAKGDQRTNILQAPKVTLYNGQTAAVSDTQSRPFVTSIIPVVGDFAAAHQPVIVVLNEGTQLHVQGVVSSDRRFVRLTLVPLFSEIGDVQEFTFEGSTTTTSGTAVIDPTDPNQTLEDGASMTVSGTTVQLPVFAFTSVTTTVNVPDGGTVLLGGIKRLREQRTERGVPLLSNLPYVNRLFKNTAVGRESSSLMMMVTPRIIIQEEEERKQVGVTN